MLGQLLGGLSSTLGGANGPESESDTIARLQNNVIRPLLESLGRTTAGDISRPIEQIMAGFNGITEALMTAHPAADGNDGTNSALMKME
jgi:hypothetical protein